MSKTRKRLHNSLLTASALAMSVVSGEVLIRAVEWKLGHPLLQRSSPDSPPLGAESPFLYSSELGYETKPFAVIRRAEGQVETLDQEGFRGRGYSIKKPPQTFRILALGDSVVQSLSVALDRSWPSVLERLLQSRSAGKTYEVINAGIGGYVSWQAERRLEKRGMKYSPDLILLHVGWNDLFYSSLPNWVPGLDLTKIEEAYLTSKPSTGQSNARAPSSISMWRRAMDSGYRHSALVRALWDARNQIFHAANESKFIETRNLKRDLTPVNTKALGLYLDNLEKIRLTAAAHHTRLALLLWPTLLAADLFEKKEFHRKMLNHYQLCPLNAEELLAWYQEYQKAQLSFLAQHPEVIKIDIAGRFRQKSPEQKLALFTDMAHMGAEGNALFAETVLAEISEIALQQSSDQ